MITDSPDPLLIGNNLTYTITVTNRGPDTARSTRLSLYLPPATLVSRSASQGNCSDGGIPSDCYLGDIISGSTVTVTYVMTPLQTGTATLSGNVVSNQVADSNPANNSATATTTVNGTADISIAVTDSPDPVRVGSTLTYTITISNSGPNAAPVNLTGSIPEQLINLVITTSQGQCYYSVNCNLGIVASGGSATVTLSGTANSRATLTFTPTASTGAIDPNTANNSATATTIVK